MSARREEVGTASGGKADGDEGALSAGLSYSQVERRRPIGTQCRQETTVENPDKTFLQ